jgi:uncharacterized protein (DUF302 family)
MPATRMCLRAMIAIWSAALLLLTFTSAPLHAYDTREGRVTLATHAPFDAFANALKQAIADHKMGLVCHANAQAGAASLNRRIPGNQVLMVYRPDFAVRMLEASVEAGFEAPIRLYIYENADGTATLTYVRPSLVFKAYGNEALDRVAAELDGILEAIVQQAMKAH